MALTTQRDLSWFGSVVLGGLSGGKFARSDVELAFEALDRNVRGDVRRQRAQERVAAACAELGGIRSHSLADLAALVALTSRIDPGCIGRTVFVDIELDASSRIREIGVAVDVDGSRHVGLGEPSELGVLDALLAGRLVVAHNGADHDFPRLRAAGVRADFVEIDSLPLAWVAWPTLPSHSLGALATRHVAGYDASTAHRADADAEVLAAVWTAIQDGLAAMSDWSRAAVRSALAGSISVDVLDRLVPAPAAAPAAPASKWTDDGGAAPSANRVLAASAGESPPGYAAVVVDDLRSSMESAHSVGVVARRSRVLNGDRLASVEDPWARAVGWRLIDVGRGLVGVAPLPLVEALLVACGSGSQLLAWPGEPMLVDALTVVGGDVARPLVVDGLWRLLSDVRTAIRMDVALPDDAQEGSEIDALPSEDRDRIVAGLRKATADGPLHHLADDGVGRLVRTDDSIEWFVPFPDPSTLSHGVLLRTASPAGGHRSARMWEALLGSDVDVAGMEAVRESWTVLDDVPASRRRPGLATAALLGVAAGRVRSGGSTIVVASQQGRAGVLVSAPSQFVARTGTHLLRPPSWPTVDEANRRLDAPSVALVGSTTARRLDGAGRSVFATGPVSVSLTRPTVARMIREAGDIAYDVTVEPLQAHLTAEFVASMDADVSFADPGPTLALLSALVGHPTRTSIRTVASDADLVEAVTPPVVARAATSAASVRLAERRLLPAGSKLKDFQEALIAEVANGHDALGIFRTGLGKSLCYQVPAVAHAQEGALTLVISPLLSLQRDQVSAMRARCIHEVTLYNSELPDETRAAIRRGVRAGFYRIVMLAPEALHSPATIRLFGDDDVALLVIDEAHCISEMGHDFRPDYRTLPVAMRRILGVPLESPLPGAGDRMAILALTGTASPSVRDDIIGALS